jgi:hypothetical protein
VRQCPVADNAFTDVADNTNTTIITNTTNVIDLKKSSISKSY